MTLRDRLFALEAFGIKLGLDNMRVLASALDHPECTCPTIHVAGTNGKGSVCAMVERALRAAGYRTGLYTSPHLDRIEERIALDGSAVSAEAFDAAATRVFTAVDVAQADGRLAVTPTFFEVTTALAFEVFRTARVEVAVVEVGLGGRFDATNVVRPLVTAITSIAFDHERHLGTTLAAIAAEKAGIAKHGVPLVTGAMGTEAAATIARQAGQVGAPIVPAAGAVDLLGLDRGRARVRPTVPRWPGMPPVALSLFGRHQVDNAATAVRLLDVLASESLRMPAEAVLVGLTDARWPARLEWLRLPEGELLIDAAHNPAGAEALASYLVDADVPPLPMVIAAMQDKDVARMVAPLARVVSRFIATSAPTPRAFAPDTLADRISSAVPDVPVVSIGNADAAVRAALADNGRAVAAGSIYVVGPLRARLIASGAVPI